MYFLFLLLYSPRISLKCCRRKLCTLLQIFGSACFSVTNMSSYKCPASSALLTARSASSFPAFPSCCSPAFSSPSCSLPLSPPVFADTRSVQMHWSLCALLLDPAHPASSSNRMILRFSLQPFRFLRGPPRERAWPLLCSTVSGK